MGDNVMCGDESLSVGGQHCTSILYWWQEQGTIAKEISVFSARKLRGIVLITQKDLHLLPYQTCFKNVGPCLQKL